ncbi:MAG TPA: hypothetical protein VG898_05305 [Solirubrobacterales bacterium]|nr:hypothetical protein [Solirubrobacterales bacterium]
MAVDPATHDVLVIERGVNEKQQLTVGATAGQFKLTFDAQTTGDLAFNATAAQVQTALRALSSIGSTGVTVTGGPGNATGSNPYVVTFQGTLATTDVEQLTPSSGTTPLSGGSGASIATTTPGISSSVKRFKPNGEPDTFSALGSNVIDGAGPGPDATPQGRLFFGTAPEAQIAVAPPGSAAGTAGNIYVTYSQLAVHAIDVFASTGAYLGQLTATGATDFEEPCGVTVDPAGAVYVGDFRRKQIHKFLPTVNPPLNADYVTSFSQAQTGIERPCALAAGAGPTAGSLFATNFRTKYSKLNGATGAFEYDIASVVGLPSTSTVLSVDPTSGHLIIARNTEVREYDASGATAAELKLRWSSPSLIGAVEGVASEETLYTARAGKIRLEEVGPFELLPPQIEAQWASDVVFTEATLKAQFPAEEEETTYHAEYLTESAFEANGESFSGPNVPTILPVPDANVGDQKVVSVALSGLLPDTTYRYRFVATNPTGDATGQAQAFTTYRPIPPQTDCPNQTLRSGAGALLPDCRAYEMVSPIDKNGGDIYNEPAGLGIHDAYIQSRPDGNKITYSAAPAFGDQLASKYYNQYIATRGAGGWSNHGINAPLGMQLKGPVYLVRHVGVFTKDLCGMWFADYNTSPLRPEGQEGLANIYRRQNCAPGEGGFETLTTAAPPSGTGLEYVTRDSVQGLSEDGSAAFFVANAKLTADAANTEEAQIYLHLAGDPAPRLVSKLPSGVAANTEGQNVVGSAYGGEGNLHNAVSADGRRIFWTAGIVNSYLRGKLYLRENPAQAETTVKNGEGDCVPDPALACTVEVSQTNNDAIFWAATENGSAAIYTEGDIRSSAATLRRFQTASGTRTVVAEGVRGVLGASEDLARIYFVSVKALTAGERNSEGDEAIEGLPNLYLWEEGAGLTYVATLPAGEATGTRGPSKGVGGSYSIVSPIPRFRAARVTPDGSRIVFQSGGALTGYDNTDANSGEAAVEVFSYEAGGELVCVSCNPTGARPRTGELSRPYVYPRVSAIGDGTDIQAAAWIPTSEHPLHASNVLSEDGDRIFFNSLDALLPRDNNGTQDVYEWELAGAGGCDVANAEFFPQNGGCLSLISSGESPLESEFWEASADGRDVFFTTASSLLPQDLGLIDLYDARVGGGFAQPAQPAICEGEACQSPPSAPDDPTPASSTFHGAGNVVESRARACRKGKVRRHGKCVKRKSKRKSKGAKRKERRTRRADHDRRSTR